VDGDIAFITINRPGQRNALSTDMLHRLHEIVTSIAHTGANALVVQSSTPSIFCAGADVKEYAAHAGDPDWGLLSKAAVEAASAALCACPVPTVAVVDGPCLGAGMSLLVACDIRLATQSSSFGIPSVRLGLFYPFRDARRLSESIGAHWARYLLLTARILDGGDAFRVGLVDELYEDRRGLEDRVTELFGHFRTTSRTATVATKKCIAAAHAYDEEPEELEVLYRTALEGDAYQEHLRRVGLTGASLTRERM
jgi:enoyl-CoA hydratase/carnithine racemase